MIHLEIEWTSPAAVADPVAGAWGVGCLRLMGEPYWGRPLIEGLGDALEWRWADLLEHLTDTWPWLVWEQGYPIDIHPSDLALRWSTAERRWESMATGLVDEEDERLHLWEQRHGLHHGLGALYARPLTLLRQGQQMLIGVDRETLNQPLESTIAALERIGDLIAARVRCADAVEAHALADNWERRWEIPPRERIAIEVGTEGDAGHHVDWFAQHGVPAAGLAESPVLAAARMVRFKPLTALERRQVWERVQDLKPSLLSGELETLSLEARARLDQQDRSARPFDQGYELARWLRGTLGLSGRLDPEQRLRRWGVNLIDASLPSGLDALAVWDPHRAAVLVNRDPPKTRQRATLAHEICHLLVDRGQALPVAEVLGGAVPEAVEMRARAFAAELLAPRAELACAVDKAKLGDPQLVKRLSRRYLASRQLVAWQLLNSGALSAWPESETAKIRRIAEGRAA